MKSFIVIMVFGMLGCGVADEERLYYSAEQKQWGIAASAVLTKKNEHDLFSLRGVPDSVWEQERNREFLEGDGWDVSGREDLIKTIERVMKTGHRSSFKQIHDSLEAGPAVYWINNFLHRLKYGYAFRPHRVAFVERYAEELAGRSLIGWDLARVISLVRWGVAAGYLEEEEAWQWIMPAAQEIQRIYGSWEELGEAYVTGRMFWSSYHFRTGGEEIRPVVYWLLKNPNSPWVKVDWNLDLTGSTEAYAGDEKLPKAEPYYEGARFGRYGGYTNTVRALLELKDSGSAYSRAMCHEKLGDYYQYGRPGIEPNLQKALSFYQTAAELGEDGAMLDLGLAYYRGKGRPKDFNRAYVWWSRAAESGHVTALRNLGILYAEGKGVEQDLEKAMELYELAGKWGDSGAENQLAWLMFKNEEVWDADQAVAYAYTAIRKDACQPHYDTLVRVLIKAGRWDEAWTQLNAWERLNMRQRNNYDPLKLPEKFKKLRERIESGRIGGA
ncbi:DUF1266 domain-containing protein [Pontiella agarivorans]|uniref:DUF1266 domain-containing protein n=1 Tax=Pontiella agarivorans TaxID=3038953 RepID=A0ABU5N0A4_9BACT|nr:DUF1266 domain-containing protein [Pontiella agarivorans]MDZ8119865.1 DUF1266 domain-containing protein [Pontiella agarivorans]